MNEATRRPYLDHECATCGSAPGQSCISIAGPNKGFPLRQFHVDRTLKKQKEDRDGKGRP